MSREKQIDIETLPNCQNRFESYGEICVRCNKCGRFDKKERNELIKLIFHTPVSSYDGRSKEELVADLVIAAGYRKQSEVAREIASNILKLSEECGGGVLFYHRMRQYAEELKNTEDRVDENNT